MKLSLKAARVNASLTQSTAAKKLGISSETLRNWEQCKSFPTVADIINIEKIYNIKYDELIFLPKNNA